MHSNRFPDDSPALTEAQAPQAPNGFVVIPVAAAEPAASSPLQWLYQKLYEQAIQAKDQPKTRDLFAVMN
jgi:hypothetical protein